MAVLTIKSVDPGKPEGKVGKVFFVEDPTKVIKYWKSAAFAGDLKEGASAEATFETVKSQNPDYPDDKFLKSWGGVTGKGRSFGGGGGGGWKGNPKDEVSIAAQVCIKDATQLAIHNALHDVKPRAVDPNEIRALSLELAANYNLVYKVIKGEQA